VIFDKIRLRKFSKKIIIITKKIFYEIKVNTLIIKSRRNK